MNVGPHEYKEYKGIGSIYLLFQNETLKLYIIRIWLHYHSWN